jgi:hypothetical protein
MFIRAIVPRIVDAQMQTITGIKTEVEAARAAQEAAIAMGRKVIITHACIFSTLIH